MALQGPIPVTFDMVFPHGCYIVGEVEPVKDFDASTNGRFVQTRDKQSGELVWQVSVMDADPTLKAAQKTVSVKILSPVQPVPPAPMAGLPFTPVEFDHMTATPYVNQAGRLAYSIKVREMRAPRPAGKTNAPAKDAA
ncbi:MULTISPECIES: plasmid replication, integration and excision activator [Nonomuraea]|uniref:Plasmid replication, integration and excision activator n=1 Tax=Nonomuraea longispora TaxID=1848320 RepID=A0A4R4N143_9ACTN|nr:plasmid replication, integration and excision activator [Nonomuraea longispora]TDC00600.1 plasmid replication, integration and excision activator [Nonomuraea longispora]